MNPANIATIREASEILDANHLCIRDAALRGAIEILDRNPIRINLAEAEKYLRTRMNKGKRMARLYHLGWPPCDIAREFGVKTASVWRTLNRHGIHKFKKMERSAEKHVAEDYVNGMSVSKLAQKYKRSKNAIRDTLKRHGVYK